MKEDLELSQSDVRSIFYKDGKMLPSRTNINYLKNHGYYDFLVSRYSDSTSIKETIYRLANNIEERPVCIVCGEPTRFLGNHGFSKWCSKKCASNDPDVLAMNRAHVSKTLKARYKKDKFSIMQKRKESLEKHYGKNNGSPFSIQKVQDKVKNTIIERYGVDNPYKLDKVKKKRKEIARNSSIAHHKELGYDIEYLPDRKILVKNGCKIHGDIIVTRSEFWNRTKPDRRNHTILCPICNPERNKETSIETLIKNILQECNVEFIEHDRHTLKESIHKELDFYIPTKKIAIECNGLWWHSGDEAKKNHLEKKNACKDLGIQLLSFWEDEINFKTDIVEDLIKSKLGAQKKRIYARACEVRSVSFKDASSFLNENHLQGNVNSSIRIGLFYGNELVQIMTFGKLRKNLASNSKEGSYELYRLCSKIGLQIIGGASKLLAHFKREIDWKEIISYSFDDISNGSVYKSLGFELEKWCGQGYSYFNGAKWHYRINRYNLRKDRIRDLLLENETADHCLKRLGYVKCWNSGVSKWKLVNQNSI